jgi:hypothetical protein
VNVHDENADPTRIAGLITGGVLLVSAIALPPASREPELVDPLQPLDAPLRRRAASRATRLAQRGGRRLAGERGRAALRRRILGFDDGDLFVS